mgnify:CR=1 FL=1
MKNLIILITLLTAAPPAFADEQALRYRGQYTFGHEVNTFCPAINSQCYWLSPETAGQQREQLKQLVANSTGKAYEAICVVVEGKINTSNIQLKQLEYEESQLKAKLENCPSCGSALTEESKLILLGE